MIAHDLLSLADCIGARAYDGKSIGPEMAAQLALVLMDLSRQAEMLEQFPIALREADVVGIDP